MSCTNLCVCYFEPPYNIVIKNRYVNPFNGKMCYLQWNFLWPVDIAFCLKRISNEREFIRNLLKSTLILKNASARKNNFFQKKLQLLLFALSSKFHSLCVPFEFTICFNFLKIFCKWHIFTIYLNISKILRRCYMFNLAFQSLLENQESAFLVFMSGTTCFPQEFTNLFRNLFIVQYTCTYTQIYVHNVSICIKPINICTLIFSQRNIKNVLRSKQFQNQLAE